MILTITPLPIGFHCRQKRLLRVNQMAIRRSKTTVIPPISTNLPMLLRITLALRGWLRLTTRLLANSVVPLRCIRRIHQYRQRLLIRGMLCISLLINLYLSHNGGLIRSAMVLIRDRFLLLGLGRPGSGKGQRSLQRGAAHSRYGHLTITLRSFRRNVGLTFTRQVLFKRCNRDVQSFFALVR